MGGGGRETEGCPGVAVGGGGWETEGCPRVAMGSGGGSPAFEWVAGTADGILVLPVGRSSSDTTNPMQLSLLPPKLSPKKGPPLAAIATCLELPRGLAS